jgi:hypothetical protein
MGGIADFVGDVFEGAADIVGDVIEGAVDIAGDVIESVASNPLLIAAAIATPYALTAMAGTTAAAGTGISLAGATTGSGLAFAPTLGAGIGSAGITSAGLGAFGGTMGISSAALGTAAAGTALGGSTFGSSSIIDPFNFSPIKESTNFGTSILEASNSKLAAFDPSQTAAQTVMGNNPTYVFDTNYLSTNTFAQAKEAASLVQSPGMSFSNALSTATNGAVTPNASTSMFSSAWDSIKGVAKSVNDLSNQADDLLNSIGKTIAPNSDPMVQKIITNTAVETTANGGDLQEALKGSLIGAGAGFAGKEVTSLTDDLFGSKTAKMLGNAAAGATGTALSGGDITQSLIGSGVGAIGSGVTDLTGNQLLGGAASTAAGAAASGADIGKSLLGYGINAGVNAGVNTGMGMASDALGLNKIDPKSITGKIVNKGASGLSSLIKQSTMSALNPNKSKLSPLSSASAQKLLQSPRTGATTQVQRPTQVVKPTLPAGTPLPNKKVDVATLTPINDINSLTGIVTK